ncbi:MAG TPA: CHRD domain-containing protein [Pyrinomonadaceae bacterium]|jgi:hypothetical protein
MQRKFFSFLLAVAAVILLNDAASAQRFVAALNSLQVVPSANSTARGTCEMYLEDTSQSPTLSISCQYSGLSSVVTSAHIHVNGPPGQNGDILINLTAPVGTTSGLFFFFEAINLTAAQAAEIRAKRWYMDFHTTNFPNGEIRGQFKIATLDFDVDGDGRTDPFVYRPSNGFGYALRSTNNSVFARQLGGQPTDLFPLIADFDGDGLGDAGFVRVNPITGAATTIYTRSRDNVVREVQWGNVALNDMPAAGDYDGDGRTDIAVYRVSNGIWYILQSSNNQPRYENWGQPGVDIPCAGNYDKDGRTDLCVNRVENNQLVWYIRRSSDNQSRRVVWGLSTDAVFPGNPVDIDGDGVNDIIVTRVENGLRFYYALRSSDNSVFALQWGLAGDGIRFGDYDGDGKTDFAALRPINNQLIWFIRQSSDNQMRVLNWGSPGDQ